MYGERVIHGCIYQARPDVNAVCHHIRMPCFRSASLGLRSSRCFTWVRSWARWCRCGTAAMSSATTDLMVVKPEGGRSLARALGPNWMVLMARHGATVAGRTLRELVFRTVYSHANAEIQLRSMAIGKIGALNATERQRAEPRQLQPRPMARAWEYWTTRLEKAGGLPPAVKSRTSGTRSKKRVSRAARGDRGDDLVQRSSGAVGLGQAGTPRPQALRV